MQEQHNVVDVFFQVSVISATIPNYVLHTFQQQELTWHALTSNLSPTENVWSILKRWRYPPRPKLLSRNIHIYQEYENILLSKLNHYVSSFPKCLQRLVESIWCYSSGHVNATLKRNKTGKTARSIHPSSVSWVLRAGAYPSFNMTRGRKKLEYLDGTCKLIHTSDTSPGPFCCEVTVQTAAPPCCCWK